VALEVFWLSHVLFHISTLCYMHAYLVLLMITVIFLRKQMMTFTGLCSPQFCILPLTGETSFTPKNKFLPKQIVAWGHVVA
jgi:hypothetical protein